MTFISFHYFMNDKMIRSDILQNSQQLVALSVLYARRWGCVVQNTECIAWRETSCKFPTQYNRSERPIRCCNPSSELQMQTLNPNRVTCPLNGFSSLLHANKRLEVRQRISTKCSTLDKTPSLVVSLSSHPFQTFSTPHNGHSLKPISIWMHFYTFSYQGDIIH